MVKVRILAREYKKRLKETKGKYISYYCTLPKKIVESLGIKPGDELECVIKIVEGKPAIVLYKSRAQRF